MHFGDKSHFSRLIRRNAIQSISDEICPKTSHKTCTSFRSSSSAFSPHPPPPSPLSVSPSLSPPLHAVRNLCPTLFHSLQVRKSSRAASVHLLGAMWSGDSNKSELPHAEGFQARDKSKVGRLEISRPSLHDQLAAGHLCLRVRGNEGGGEEGEG